MKIVLPLAGKGTRLLPHTENTPKPLMYVAGATILDHLLSKLIPLNPTEFVFIVGYLKEQIIDHMKTHYPDLPVRFVEQPNPQGLGHAIYQARDAFSKDEDMMVVLGDQTFVVPWEKLIDSSANVLCVTKVEDPSSFGVVMVDENHKILEMEEKPENPKSDLAISGIYYFPSAQSVFSTIAHQIAKDIRTKGEIQITDSMRIMMDSGEVFKAVEIQEWNDCGNHTDLLSANQTLLKDLAEHPKFDDSVKIIEPVTIHPSVKITNSTVGPNVSIDADCMISNATISNSVLNQNVQVSDAEVLDSYIGADVKITNTKNTNNHLA
ncbi:MAG: sugar phosphate nucleotidyltransferase [Brevinema sp.]